MLIYRIALYERRGGAFHPSLCRLRRHLSPPGRVFPARFRRFTIPVENTQKQESPAKTDVCPYSPEISLYYSIVPGGPFMNGACGVVMDLLVGALQVAPGNPVRERIRREGQAPPLRYDNGICLIIQRRGTACRARKPGSDRGIRAAGESAPTVRIGSSCRGGLQVGNKFPPGRNHRFLPTRATKCPPGILLNASCPALATNRQALFVARFPHVGMPPAHSLNASRPRPPAKLTRGASPGCRSIGNSGRCPCSTARRRCRVLR